MVQEGMLQEGFDIVKTIRARFDGEKRNPWNEFECGNNYARSLASYSLIPAISGFTYDLARGYLGFDPKAELEGFCSFFSVDSGWGRYTAEKTRLALEVQYGSVSIAQFGLPAGSPPAREVLVGKTPVRFVRQGNVLVLEQPVALNAGDALQVRF